MIVHVSIEACQFTADRGEQPLDALLHVSWPWWCGHGSPRPRSSADLPPAGDEFGQGQFSFLRCWPIH